MPRRTRDLAAILVPAVAAITLAAASPALGKSDVELTLSSLHPGAGRAVRITATGGNDDSGSDSQVCVEIRSARRWRTLRCSRMVADDSSAAAPTVRLSLRETHPAVVRLRAQLFEADLHGRHRVPRQMTGVQTIRFTR